MTLQLEVLVVATLVIVPAMMSTGPRLAQTGEAGPLRSHHVVEIRNLRFEPAELTVAQGDTVTWINRDIVPHTASAVDAEWSSGGLSTGDSWPWIARTEGRISYFCEYHPTMKGSVIVR